MIRHIVIVNFRETFNMDYLSLMEKTRPYLDEIPGILSVDFFSNISKYVPEGVTSVGAEIIFNDVKALNVFMDHPKHYEANALFEEFLADPPFMVLTHEMVVQQRS